jgi:hypothetical protein
MKVDMKFVIFLDMTQCLFGIQVPTVSSNLQSQILRIQEISEKCAAVTEALSIYQST